MAACLEGMKVRAPKVLRPLAAAPASPPGGHAHGCMAPRAGTAVVDGGQPGIVPEPARCIPGEESHATMGRPCPTNCDLQTRESRTSSPSSVQPSAVGVGCSVGPRPGWRARQVSTSPRSPDWRQAERQACGSSVTHAFSPCCVRASRSVRGSPSPTTRHGYVESAAGGPPARLVPVPVLADRIDGIRQLEATTVGIASINELTDRFAAWVERYLNVRVRGATGDSALWRGASRPSPAVIAPEGERFGGIAAIGHLRGWIGVSRPSERRPPMVPRARLCWARAGSRR